MRCTSEVTLSLKFMKQLTLQCLKPTVILCIVSLNMVIRTCSCALCSAAQHIAS